MKNTTQHTPGPWGVSPSGFAVGSGLNPAQIINSPIAWLGDTGRESGQQMANARLIAAAPDLLSALLDALPYVEDILSDHEQLACFKAGTVQRHAAAIRAAIAKATGGAA